MRRPRLHVSRKVLAHPSSVHTRDNRAEIHSARTSYTIPKDTVRTSTPRTRRLPARPLAPARAYRASNCARHEPALHVRFIASALLHPRPRRDLQRDVGNAIACGRWLVAVVIHTLTAWAARSVTACSITNWRQRLRVDSRQVHGFVCCFINFAYEHARHDIPD